MFKKVGGVERKKTEDIVRNHSDGNLAFRERAANRAFRKVNCDQCGLGFNIHINVIKRRRWADQPILCTDCFRAGKKEIGEAIVATERRRNKCIAEARRLSQEAKMKGAI